MTNLLWIFLAINIAYLLYALSKAKKVKSKAQEVPSLADETRILNVPDEMLTVGPVGKTVTIKDEPKGVNKNPWGEKIVRNDHRMGVRKNWDHNQLLLKDIDNNLSN